MPETARSGYTWVNKVLPTFIKLLLCKEDDTQYIDIHNSVGKPYSHIYW